MNVTDSGTCQRIYELPLYFLGFFLLALSSVVGSSLWSSAGWGQSWCLCKPVRMVPSDAKVARRMKRCSSLEIGNNTCISREVVEGVIVAAPLTQTSWNFSCSCCFWIGLAKNPYCLGAVSQPLASELATGLAICVRVKKERPVFWFAPILQWFS